MTKTTKAKNAQKYCDCWKHCMGGRMVSRSTHYSHTQYRCSNAQQTSTQQSQPAVQNLVPGTSDTHRDKRQRTGPSLPTATEPPSLHPIQMHLHSMDCPKNQNFATSGLEAGALDGSPLSDIPREGATQVAQVPSLASGASEGLPGGTIAEEGQDLETREDEEAIQFSRIQDVRVAQEFIEALRHPDLRNGDLNESDLEDLLNPPQGPLEIDETQDRELFLCLRLYLSQILASQSTYTNTIEAIKIAHPEDTLLSFDQIKRRIRQMTGVRSIVKDMCPTTCLAYTGPFSGLDMCPKCNEPRYEPGNTTPRQEFYTLPLGFVIQAFKRDPETAENMNYFNDKTKKCLEELTSAGKLECLDDIWCGTDILQFVSDGKIGELDTPLMMSFDGAQVYRNKASDCWIFIWVFLGISPCKRYKCKYVIPGGFIPGPNKPKIVESFLFPGLHHVAVLNANGGLPVWDSYRRRFYLSLLIIILATADGPGMAYLNGLVGHSGKIGCRLWCGLVGRRKNGGSHYYPVLFKPNNYTIAGCSHADSKPAELRPIDIDRYKAALEKVVSSATQTSYEENRRETGICKPSIFTGLEPHILGIPSMFPGDIMHLVLNLADLLIPLWRGTFDCASTDSKASWPWAVLGDGDLWKDHGKDVAASQPHLPGSFGRPPRNPAEKINSGYKAWEFLLYMFGLGPGIFYRVLPDNIWSSYCRLVFGIRTIYQKRITPAEYKAAHQQLILFTVEFERLYVQRRADRIHFVRQSIHSLSHQVPEAVRVGPGPASSQWTMERAIGDHTEEIKQHSQVYAHLSQIGLRRARVNALKAVIPALDKSRQNLGHLPRGSIDLGKGFVLLRKRARGRYTLDGDEFKALKAYVQSAGAEIPENWSSADVVRWARLRLPNGQVARSAWIENPKGDVNIRISRNVKLPAFGGQLEFGEVQFLFQFEIEKWGATTTKTLALIHLYERPDATLLRESHLTLWSCRKGLRASQLRIIDVCEMEAAVAMVPHSVDRLGEEWAGRYFVVEKPGLDVAEMGGALDDLRDEEDGDEENQ